ncbi:aminopeptidase [Candidatus Gastranaerophilales bacterium]|nr:MAG: aminopeptidase [Candidatus Gastranaerophilales bacterium]
MKTLWDKYAEVLVDYSTNVQKGDLVQIRGTSVYTKDLVKAVYKRVLERGGNPIVRTSIEDLTDTFIKYASDEQLDFVDPITKLEYETVDKFISIGGPMNTKNLAKADMKKLARRGKATKALSELLMKRSAEGSASWVIADVPTHALAQEAKMSFDEYSEFLFKSCYLDMDNPVAKLKELNEKQTKWANYLNNVKKLRITGEKTDITFGVEGRKWISCSGLNNYPDGEVFTSPVEDDVNGEIYFDFPQIYRGNEAQGVHLWIENGKIVKAKADKGEDFLIAMLDMDEGSRGIGEIAIGTNDRIQEVTGNILFDEKIGGSIHMAVGASYPEAGGKNVSGLHWDLIKNMKGDETGKENKIGGKIYADDVLIYENGKFLI